MSVSLVLNYFITAEIIFEMKTEPIPDQPRNPGMVVEYLFIFAHHVIERLLRGLLKLGLGSSIVVTNISITIKHV